MFYCFTAFLTVIAVNINRVGMHAFVNGQAQHDYWKNHALLVFTVSASYHWTQIFRWFEI